MKDLQQHLHELSGLIILVRCNYDVPLADSHIGDTTRIDDSVPTIKALKAQGNSVILLAHAGRPDGAFDSTASLHPVRDYLAKALGEPVAMVEYQTDYHQLAFTDAPVQLVDNLRFWPQEEANDPDFAAFLASHGTAYVNEAFANCHRAHASTVGLPAHFPGHAYAGLSLAREIEILNKVTHNPDRPLVVVIGGAKLETKEPLVMALAPKADQVLVGGKIALDLKDRPNLPANVVLAGLDPSGKDITAPAAQTFAEHILAAKTVIWNGSMGVFEDPLYQTGTKIVAQAINDTPAYTVIGGGDTETALTELNLEAGIDYISTGGGAMLTYLSEGHLVALDALAPQPYETAT